jgi:hypothetical protein
MEHVQGIVEDTENEREVIDNNKYIINKEVWYGNEIQLVWN